MYALNLLEIAPGPGASTNRTYEDLATKFFEHFAYIAAAAYEQGLWDEEDAFFYDVLRQPDGATGAAEGALGRRPAAARGDDHPSRSATLARLPELAARLRWFLTNKPEYADVLGARAASATGSSSRLLSMVGPDQLLRILSRMLDEEEFLSPYGLRALSRAHLDKPFTVTLGGIDFTVGYEPGESTTRRCSAATPTGAARSGSRSTTCSSRRCAGTTASSATTCIVEYPTGLAGPSSASARSPTTCPAAWSSLFLPTATAAGRSTATYELFQKRPRLAGPDPVLRVLPRRHRSRARRLAPDRLDRAGRRPHPHAVRRPE